MIRVLIYLSQFQLNIKYCLEKQYIISDILFRLSTIKDLINKSFTNSDILDLNIYYSKVENSESNQIYIYQSIIVSILVDYKVKLLDNYTKKVS